MLDTTRIKWAARFGKAEHYFALVLGWTLIIYEVGFVCVYIRTKSLLFFQASIIGVLPLILWMLYHYSHKIEKLLYPKTFRFQK
jgi:hypothetical protein